MGTIYRRLVFEINRLQEIIKENKLDIRWINELESIKNAIPDNEMVKKRRFFSKKAIQPDDMELFSIQKQKYIDIHQSVCDDISGLAIMSERNDIAENRHGISFLEKLEDKIVCPGKYIHIENIMPKLDLSDARELLEQYIDVLENTSVYLEEKRKFEKTIYEQLVYRTDGIFDTIDREICGQQDYFKTRLDFLADIESEYKKKATESYGEFIGLTVSKKMMDYVNRQIIKPWNQIYESEIVFSKLVKAEEICIPFADGKAVEVKSKAVPAFWAHNPEWAKYSETYIACTENALKEIFAENTKDYIDKCISICLKDELEIIGRKKNELFERESQLEDHIIYLEELQNQLRSQKQELEEYYSNIKIRPVKVKIDHSDDTGTRRGFKGPIILIFMAVLVIGFLLGGRKNKNSAVDDMQESIDSAIKVANNAETTEEVETTESIEKVEKAEKVETAENRELIESEESIEATGPTENTVIETTEEQESTTEVNGTISDTNYILPESSTKYLTERDLGRLDGEALRLARNEIFARHGRLFQTEDLNDYFSNQPWYHGYLSEEEFDDSILNNYERVNLDLIKSLEHNLAVAEEEAILSSNAKNKETRGYILPESDSRYLSMEDLEGLDINTLRLARNEIFARHGRLFQSEDLNEYFSNQPWYHGYLSAEEFDDSVLNNYERTNLDLIRSLEN